MEEINEDIKLFLGVFPQTLKEKIYELGHFDELIEIVLDLGRKPEARYQNNFIYLSEKSVTGEDLDLIIGHVGEFDRDNRAGIEKTLHRISAVRNRKGEVVGLTCRVGRALYGKIDIIKDIIESGKSILLLGRPGVGKTTLLREASRVLSDELKKRVVIVDTSNEIGGDGDIPHPGIGLARRMQVPLNRAQHDVMIEAVENHNPEIIIIDEIGRKEEAEACRTIAERGVCLIATAHGNNLLNLITNPTLEDLIGGIQAVTLGDEEAQRRGTQKTVLERKAQPTFDILVEIKDRNTLAIYKNLADVVDAYLRNYEVLPEIRVRKEAGFEIVGKKKSSEKEEMPTIKELKEIEIFSIFPVGLSLSYFERAIHSLRSPVVVVRSLEKADILVVSELISKKNPHYLEEAKRLEIPVYIIEKNTLATIKDFLRRLKNQVGKKIDWNGWEYLLEMVLKEEKPKSFPSADSYTRRMQHKLAERYGLYSESEGVEPYRKVVIYPPKRK